jgi:hypothetical protein
MLEIRGAAPGLLDDPLLLDVAGAAPNSDLTWRARLRDDDGFSWRAQAATSADLLTAWSAKPTAGAVMALRSLRPVQLDVRVEDPDGAAASRTITRALLADGVKVRRWKGDVTGTLHLPAPGGGSDDALVIDARGAGGRAAAAETAPPPPEAGLAAAPPAVETSPPAAALAAAPIAAALIASRGVLTFLATGGRGAPAEVLGALPAPPAAITTIAVADLPLPPGAGAAADPAAWDALLAELGATPRRVAR